MVTQQLGANPRLLDALEAFRRHRGLSQAAFAKWLGRRSAQEWAHVRAGRRPVPRAMVRTARQLAEAEGPLWASRIANAIAEDALAQTGGA